MVPWWTPPGSAESSAAPEATAARLAALTWLQWPRAPLRDSALPSGSDLGGAEDHVAVRQRRLPQSRWATEPRELRHRSRSGTPVSCGTGDRSSPNGDRRQMWCGSSGQAGTVEWPQPMSRTKQHSSAGCELVLKWRPRRPDLRCQPGASRESGTRGPQHLAPIQTATDGGSG